MGSVTVETNANFETRIRHVSRRQNTQEQNRYEQNLKDISSEVAREHKLAPTLFWHDARACVIIDINIAAV